MPTPHSLSLSNFRPRRSRPSSGCEACWSWSLWTLVEPAFLLLLLPPHQPPKQQQPATLLQYDGHGSLCPKPRPTFGSTTRTKRMMVCGVTAATRWRIVHHNRRSSKQTYMYLGSSNLRAGSTTRTAAPALRTAQHPTPFSQHRRASSEPRSVPRLLLERNQPTASSSRSSSTRSSTRQQLEGALGRGNRSTSALSSAGTHANTYTAAGLSRVACVHHHSALAYQFVNVVCLFVPTCPSNVRVAPIGVVNWSNTRHSLPSLLALTPPTQNKHCSKPCNSS
jgi:hypothetical protein